MNLCPVCDAEGAKLDILEAFTLGAGLGEACADLGRLRDTMCTKHRIAHVLSMATLRMKVDALHAAAPSGGSDG